MIFAVIGPSGAGKDTYCKVFDELGIKRAVSSTTRDKRKGEEDGINYFFENNINEDFFKRMNSSPAHDKHRGVYYFTEEKEFKKEKNVYCQMSKKGIKDLRDYFGKENVYCIYVYCNEEDVEKRLSVRDGIINAKKRMECNKTEKSYDDINLADFCIINKDSSDIFLNKNIMKMIILSNME